MKGAESDICMYMRVCEEERKRREKEIGRVEVGRREGGREG